MEMQVSGCAEKFLLVSFNKKSSENEYRVGATGSSIRCA
jgi:hypothetical protein